MPELKCPVCGGELVKDGGAFCCRNGHSYDISRRGYVNLLMSNSSSGKRHGDDRLMVSARSAFLDAGYYDCLRRELCRLAVKYCAPGSELLDAGCGEGYYTAAVRKALETANGRCRACGADISREALIRAAKRDVELTLAVASINALPVPELSCDLVLSVFAPDDAAEFRRVLKKGGVLLRAVPLERHLFGLKAAVYDRPYENPPPDYGPEGFHLVERADVRDDITLTSPELIRALFMMTPYYYKTGRADQEKLLALSSLETEIAFGVYALKKD